MAGATARRRGMIDRLRLQGITDERVLAAMGTVPRERFVLSELAEVAYDDHPLPIGGGQTISSPGIVARMAAAPGLSGGERVLEIGTGHGYAAAVLGCCGAEVVSIEYDTDLVDVARRCLVAAGIDGVEVRHGRVDELGGVRFVRLRGGEPARRAS